MENEDLYELIEEEENENDTEDYSNPGFKETALVGTAGAKMKKSKHKKKKKVTSKMTHFERRYSKLALEQVLIPERKRIDFVLVHPTLKVEAKEKEKRKSERNEHHRNEFENLLISEGFSIQENVIGQLTYKKLHCPFKRLCYEAEKVKLEMPLKDCGNPEEPESGCIGKFIERHLETDNEVDFVSSQFYMDKIEMYQNHQDPSNFFRPSLRSLLVNHILINLDIRTEQEKIEGSKPDDDDPQSKFDTIMNYMAPRESHSQENEEKNRKVLKKKGLPYLLMKGVYTDCMILHENSQKRKTQEHGIDEHFDEDDDSNSNVSVKLEEDPRKELDDTWSKFFKFQPLWKIRNYFGEKIAFYFAWSGLLTTSLWLPSLLGLIIFIYGLVMSVSKEEKVVLQNGTVIDEIKNAVVGVLDLIKEAFDNDATPYFGLIICLWGTIFLEAWKRLNSRLAYEWDVEDFESKEPDRPQFYGTTTTTDPVTSEEIWFYPFKRKLMKIFASSSVLIFMMLLVLISVTSVIIYRVIIDVDYCPGITGTECLLLTTVISSLFNAVSILILGKLYDKLAVFLTEWENHRTQTGYDDSLIIKLFAFQFVNSYASCFYIAFFRGRFDNIGLLGRGEEYKDDCQGTCMSQLSFQVLVLMFVKPLPKLLKDIIIPFLRKLWAKRPACLHFKCCCCCRRQNKVEENSTGVKPSGNSGKILHKDFLERERQKPSLGDFTLGEYTEKVIQYGFLMLFAASFPLAPILALCTNLVDLRVDAKRMLWWYRRPIAFIAQDIGKWYDILYFVNIIGVITNAFLIAFTSSWGKDYTLYEKLWVVIGFEHIVFTLKYVMAAMIPDTPTEVHLAIRREKYQIAKKMEDSRSKKEINYRQLYPGSRSRLPSDNPDNSEDANFMMVQSNPNADVNNINESNRARSGKDNSINDEGTEELSQNTPWYMTDHYPPSSSSHTRENTLAHGRKNSDEDYGVHFPPPTPHLPNVEDSYPRHSEA
ncbi:hypothetical protein LOTGIDRAFT_234280 [Lottia gigantea]|uniref:Anoctamin n=1 Tax=Lottia gigantea TaxID=225164 RepID=V4A829_LOTGI|nr:hypothetical protein LOTGIDRAFT_234280 [Lottia gigantea]ESO89426.1 hypothetical protein LOTGIDRAFT_234280 [Lottia gigantea]